LSVRQVSHRGRCVCFQVGASSFPGSDIYCGPSPFSEPETKAVSEYLKTLPNLVGVIDYHSYSQVRLPRHLPLTLTYSGQFDQSAKASVPRAN
jgi:zinc carboxypeptidase